MLRKIEINKNLNELKYNRKETVIILVLTCHCTHEIKAYTIFSNLNYTLKKSFI